MPLQSRASAARLARTNPEEAAKAPPATEGTIAETIQPRRGAAGKPAPAAPPARPQTDLGAAQSAAQDAQSEPPYAASADKAVAETGAALRGEAPHASLGSTVGPALAAKRERKPRAPRAAAPATASTGEQVGELKTLKQRMSEIEKEYKQLPARETAARRELEAQFKAQRQQLENEHRELSLKVSQALFHG